MAVKIKSATDIATHKILCTLNLNDGGVFFSSGYLLMPDPRSVDFSSGIVIGSDNHRSDAFDEYGRKPSQT